MSTNNTQGDPAIEISSAGKNPMAAINPAPQTSEALPPQGTRGSNLSAPAAVPDSAATATISNTTTSTKYAQVGQKRPAPAAVPSSPSGTPGTPSKTGKKRPYRRTKRPIGYNDRSTVTAVTPKAASEAAGINEYDLVMAEAEDLLNASLEAQKLGRLKMASAYQLLLHTRLVGLGKRVDRSILPAAAVPRHLQRQKSREMEEESDNDAQRPSMASRLATASETDDAKPAARTEGNSSNTPPAPPPDTREKQMLQQLSSILPQGAEMDASMMEHLARAAAELHHQRTGRRRTSDGLLAATNTLNALAAMKNVPPQPSVMANTQPPAIDPAIINATWSQAEVDIVQKGITKGWQPETIAKILSNKNENQVRAFLQTNNCSVLSDTLPAGAVVSKAPRVLSAARNKKAPTRSVPNAAGGGASASSSTKAAAASITQNITGDAALRAHTGAEVVAASVVGGIPLDASSPERSKRGGRGRKPATTAMNTVATVSLDVKTLLQFNHQRTSK